MKFIWQVFVSDDCAVTALPSENSTFRLVGNPEKSVRQTWLIGQKGRAGSSRKWNTLQRSTIFIKSASQEPCCESIITCGEVSSYSSFLGAGETVCVSHPGCAANHFRAYEATTPSSWSTRTVRDGATAERGNTSCPFSAPCLIQTFGNRSCFLSGDARLGGSCVHMVME